eukprot:TRINITY_DN63196_c0_g2_i1.p1 TRINITY_DN63196_c0_g2~~TRINITY_DN63196_c0_g2_i1.p1  ORF type:complete len:486 (-),score=43.53 TRINITY_DN63196_c0_g2_i1:401-1858(-)
MSGQQTLGIKFIVLPEGFVYYAQFPPSIPCVYLYNQITRELKVDRRNTRITYKGTVLHDTDVLNEVAQISPKATQLELNLEFDFMPKHLAIVNKAEYAQRTLEVEISYGEGIPGKLVHVTVVKGYDKKNFLGGYRNKRTGIEFHHCGAQTDPLKKQPKPKPPCYSRVTQTAGITRSQQTKREAFTQMARPGLEIDEQNDKYYTPRPYFSAAQLHELRIEKTVNIQAHVRGWFARRLAKKMRAEEQEAIAVLQLEELRRKEIHETKRQKEIERRTHPRTPNDFSVLLNELEAWRLQETNKIKESSLSPKEKQLALQELLKKETRLLQTIDKLKIKAGKENKKGKIENDLQSMAAHKVWNHPKTGSQTVVETPFTVRAKELLDLYNGLQLRDLTIDERLDILLHVKWTVKEFECALTREIVELVDREADLLNRGRKDKRLEALRNRMSNLFLQFCETPEFNPEAINHQRVPLEFTFRPLVKLDGKKT